MSSLIRPLEPVVCIGRVRTAMFTSSTRLLGTVKLFKERFLYSDFPRHFDISAVAYEATKRTRLLGSKEMSTMGEVFLA